MKSFIMVLALVSTLGMVSAAGAADNKLGFVDVQKVLLMSDAGKEAKDQLTQKAGKLEGEKNAREEELKKLKAELEKQSVLLSEAARNAKEKDYQQKYKEYQRFVKDAQDDLQARNEELTNRLVEGIVKIIQEYGRAKGYTFIFVKNDSMIYADDSADLTDEIQKKYNASRKK